MNKRFLRDGNINQRDLSLAFEIIEGSGLLKILRRVERVCQGDGVLTVTRSLSHSNMHPRCTFFMEIEKERNGRGSPIEAVPCVPVSILALLMA